MTTFDDFTMGTKVLSARNSQPGIVIAAYRDGGWFANGRDWFEVEWERHKGGTSRIYHRNPIHDSDDFGGFPTIVDRFDWETEPTNEEIASDLLVFVDPIADAKDSLTAAFSEAAALNSDGGVSIDVNKLFLSLANNGWTYTPKG